MNTESNPIKIAGRAREIWEAEGKPEGREERHWQIAMLEAEESPRGFFERAVGFEATMDFAETFMLYLRHGGGLPARHATRPIKRKWNFIRRLSGAISNGLRRW